MSSKYAHNLPNHEDQMAVARKLRAEFTSQLAYQGTRIKVEEVEERKVMEPIEVI